ERGDHHARGAIRLPERRVSNPRHDAGNESAGSEESEEGAGDAPDPFV
ncbi:MAG: hypothetical protein AVDCRST_MAG78-3074, partial [uncultured Rubrobacteraceae bacterium]